MNYVWGNWVSIKNAYIALYMFLASCYTWARYSKVAYIVESLDVDQNSKEKVPFFVPKNQALKVVAVSNLK